MASFRLRFTGCVAALVLLNGLVGPTFAAHDPGVPLGPAVGVAFDGDGTLWRVMAEEGALLVDRSGDQGRSFDAPVLIDARSAPPRVRSEDAPQVLVDDDRVLVAWAGLVRGKPQAMVSESRDGGRSFSEPRPVGGTRGAQIRVTLAAAEPEPRLLFLDPAGGRPGGRLFAASLDPAPGQSLQAASLAGATCECCRLDAATAPDGSLVVLSRMIFPGGVRDFALIREQAPGESQVLRAPADEWRIDACPEHGGALAIGGDGRYHLTWFTQGERRQGAFYAQGAPDGSWSTPVALGDPARLPGHADVLVMGDQVHVAWQQFDGRNLSIHAMSSADGGRSFGAARELAATTTTADYPRLVTDGGQAFVSWYAREPGYRLIALEDAAAPAPAGVQAQSGPAGAPAGTQAFERDSLAAITAGRKGQPFLLVMWSIDCGPCLKELREFAAIREAGRELPLVLVSTDDRARTDEVAATLARFDLADVESWIFATDNHQQLRYAVDPRWYGELPRGYFYAGDGSRRAHSGGLTRPQIEAWLSAIPL